jgi:hypothetical protein
MEFNFDHLISPEMLAKVRARKAEVRTSLYKKLVEKGETLPEEFSIVEPDITYSATRADLSRGLINARYFNTRADLLNHLVNVGYMSDYATKKLIAFESDEFQLPTDSEKIVYVVKKHIKDSDKFSRVMVPGRKVWLLNMFKFFLDSGKEMERTNFLYYIDEEKNVYRENTTDNTILKMGLTGYNIRILWTNVSVNRLWDSYRLDEVKRGE